MPQKRKPSSLKNHVSGGNLGELLSAHPAILSALHEHGIHFCSGCYLTLFSPLEKAAAYHAVTDIKKFLKDVEERLNFSSNCRC